MWTSSKRDNKQGFSDARVIQDYECSQTFEDVQPSSWTDDESHPTLTTVNRPSCYSAGDWSDDEWKSGDSQPSSWTYLDDSQPSSYSADKWSGIEWNFNNGCQPSSSSASDSDKHTDTSVGWDSNRKCCGN